jgi:hypothetical protein
VIETAGGEAPHDGNAVCVVCGDSLWGGECVRCYGEPIWMSRETACGSKFVIYPGVYDRPPLYCELPRGHDGKHRASRGRDVPVSWEDSQAE